MKKFISLLLAILMIFSVATVAFAADETPAPEEETTATDDAFDPMDLPVWTVIAGLKVGKIVIKIVSVLVKIASALGLIDLKEVLQGIIDQIANGGQTPEESAPAVSEAPAP